MYLVTNQLVTLVFKPIKEECQSPVTNYKENLTFNRRGASLTNENERFKVSKMVI